MKHGSNVYPFVQSDLSGNSIYGDVHYEHIRGMEVQKYLREGCYHHIKYFAANFLATLIWRRPLNITTLVAPTHRGLVRVSDGTSTQVVAWTTDKWRAKIIERGIYNVRDS